MNLTVAMGLKAIVVRDDVADDDMEVSVPLASAAPLGATSGVADRVPDGVASVSKVIFSASNCSSQCRFGLKPWERKNMCGLSIYLRHARFKSIS